MNSKQRILHEWCLNTNTSFGCFVLYTRWNGFVLSKSVWERGITEGKIQIYQQMIRGRGGTRKTRGMCCAVFTVHTSVGKRGPKQQEYLSWWWDMLCWELLKEVEKWFISTLPYLLNKIIQDLFRFYCWLSFFQNNHIRVQQNWNAIICSQF